MEKRNEGWEKRRVEALRVALSTPEHRQKQKDAWKSPEFREKVISAHRGMKYSDKSRAKMSESIKKAMSRPDVVAKAKKHINDPAWRKKVGDGSREAWARPGAKEKRIKKLQEVWEKPGMKDKYSGENSRWWRGGNGQAIADREWIILARKIRERDGGLCQHPSCYSPSFGRLHCVHHIDYDRTHNESVNLITLCISHHALTTIGDREYWMEFYQEIQSVRGLGGFGF